MARTPQEILQHHGASIGAGDLEGILADRPDDAVLITRHGTFRGTAGARDAWLKLLGDLPNPKVELSELVVEGELVLMKWTATTDNGRVEDGIDTMVLSPEGIRLQTVHCTVTPA